MAVRCWMGVRCGLLARPACRSAAVSAERGGEPTVGRGDRQPELEPGLLLKGLLLLPGEAGGLGIGMSVRKFASPCRASE